ncbi:MAG: hypothetical protein LBU12_05445 [Deltaproteobacteria bacterium]|jgi:hypothetical protein|nr:hypothetical protein [Deltaproteobacteria bacterium]
MFEPPPAPPGLSSIWTAAAANSTNNLAQVQAGFAVNSPLTFDQVKYLLAVVVGIAAISTVLALLSRRRKKSRLNQGWSSITNSQSIWEILTKAVARQAHFTLDVYEAARTVNFRGVLSSLEDDAYLALTLTEAPSAEAVFNDLPGVIHVNFRPAPKEPLEHYQFSTKIADTRYVKVNTWREAQFLLPIPKVVTSAQRRSFMRLEPADEYAFDCRLFNVPEGNIASLETLEPVSCGAVMDISIGGAQLKLPPNVTLRETQRFVGVMMLPTTDLDAELADQVLVVLIQLLSQEFVRQSSPSGPEAHNVLRVRFLGRYLKDAVLKVWSYRGLTLASLEDLSRWMLSYQRHQIKRKLHFLPPDPSTHRPPNMFPAVPPKRPPLKDD